MSIDLTQFIATFLEESYEGLEVMESSLLNLDSADEETINTIFRAAHSIKGGAGTFGFTEVADFTHAVETMLDEMRSGKKEVTPPLVNLLLESVDCIKALLEAAQDGPEADPQMISQVQMRLQQALEGAAETATGATVAAPDQAPDQEEQTREQTRCWDIHFIPNADLLQGGHEPALMFAALAELGRLRVEPVTDTLPVLADVNPQNLYLSWKLTLESDCSEAEIREIFEWVEDECELNISSHQVDAVSAAAVTGWEIRFIPDAGLLQTGNEPSFMFAALAELGKLSVTANTDKLPPFADLSADQLYLSWTMILESDCSKEQVQEIFEWVEDECKLEITALPAAASEAVTEPADIQPVALENTPAATPAVATQAVARGNAPATQATATKAIASKASATPARNARPAVESSSIRVDTDKIDALINRVGELVITQAMLGQVGAELADVAGAEVERLQAGLEQLERNTRDLQEDVMRVRMLPISFVFNRFPRLVHDVSGKLGKKVELIISGEQTEIDKTVMEKIGDPMVHLIRNSLDHGLEEPQERLAAGKPETGSVQLNAYHQGGFIVIDIIDDGRGLNTRKIREKALEKGLVSEDQQLSDVEINELIFNPGFSTADEVSDLSGRGVGMDVVRRNIESLGGHVSVKSEPGQGSAFSVRLPLTLAILEGQLVRIYDQTYIIPLVSIVETVQANSDSLSPIAGENKLLHFREEYIPLIYLRALFNLPSTKQSGELDSNLVAIVESGGEKVGLVVDELYGQQQVVIKSLEVNFKRIEGLAGATILGDGSVALILDVAGLMKRGLDFEIAQATSKSNDIFNNRQSQGSVA